MNEKGTTRYPGVRTINAINASSYINRSQFNSTNQINVSLDTSMLEMVTTDDDNGNAIEEYTFTGKVAGISPALLEPIEKKYVLKVTFYYSNDVMYIGSKDFPAILNIKKTTGQTGGNFIGGEINFNCQYPSVRRIEM